MKNSIIYLTLFVVFASACAPTKSESPIATPDTTEHKSEKIVSKAPECDLPTGHPIDLDSAALLISNFLNSPKGQIYMDNSASNPRGRGFGIGNYISINTLSNKLGFDSKNKDFAPNQGIVFYDLLFGKSALFAMKNTSICYKNKRDEYAIKPDSNYFITSLKLADPTGFTKEEVLQYLDEQFINEANRNRVYDPITGSNVIIQNHNLIGATGGFWSHSSHGSFFFNLSDFKRLIGEHTNEVSGFVIFRGIEIIKENNRTSNFDRLILIAVDINGDFMLNNNVILERSWPPRGF